MSKQAYNPDIAQQMTVGNLTRGNVLTCDPDMKLEHAIGLMHGQRRSSIVVTCDNRPVGMWTEHDCIRLDARDTCALQGPVSDVMSSPVRTISAHATAETATLHMRKHKMRHLVVVDDQGKLFGIVSQSDLVRLPVSLAPLRERNIASILRKTIAVAADLPVAELQHIMAESTSDCAIIVGNRAFDLADTLITGENGETGSAIVTERDILAHIAGHRPGITAWDISSHPVRRVHENTSLQNARQIMIESGIRHLVVEDAQHVMTGVLSFADLLETIETDYLHHMHHVMEGRDTALARAQKSLYLAQKIIESSPDGIMIVDGNGKIEDVNPAFVRVTGYDRKEAIGQTPGLLQSGRHGPDFYKEMWQNLSRTGRWQGEIWNRRKSGEIYPEWLSIIAIRDDMGQVIQYAGTFTDISERKQTAEHIKRLSHHDDLTGLPNRRQFLDATGRASAQSRRTNGRMAVVLLDIDNFQRVNNSLGHATGDDILVEIAIRLQRALPENAVFARMGGDGFAVLLPVILDGDDARAVAGSMQQALTLPYLAADGTEVVVTASIGISVFPNDGRSTAMLLSNADAAMYRSKTQGGNQISYYSNSLSASDTEKLSLESALRHAVERGELFLQYQPQWDTQNGHLVGVEALVRWRHPGRGVLSPGSFITLAEEIGCIDEIGQWVLRTACAQGVVWRERGIHNITISVNVSVRQFNSPVDLGDLVEQVLGETGFAGHRLDLEITESLFMEDIERVDAKLRHLRQLGVQVSLDDFGTGFSSLSYLRQLPFDTVKIDRSFVNDIGRGDDDGGNAIVQTIINMAHNLGKKCVAEGIETEEQRQFLQRNNCNILQGYLLGRPMDPDQIETLARLL
ncbi:MAG: EAL domain-containing protein [Pseudomonadota bacterium]